MYGQPMMAPQPMYSPPPAQQGPMVINLGGNSGGGDGSPCPSCGKDTGNIPRKKIGCVTIAWCFCLLVFSVGTAWCYPFCTDSCKDTELICVKCHTVKSKIPANCC